MRDLDIDMFYDQDKGEFYCIRCQFVGDEKKILAWNDKVREKYGWMNTRFEKFNFD